MFYYHVLNIIIITIIIIIVKLCNKYINEASNVRPIGVFQFIFPQSAKLTQISGILSIVLH